MALILASRSEIRRAMLDNAGIAYEALKPEVDEDELKRRFDTATEIASELAAAKASAVSAERPDDFVIGSDSIVSVNRRLYDKPRDRSEAVEHLLSFSGKPMQLTSAVALARGGTVDWRHVENATLQVRQLSEAFIEDYLNAEWPDVGYTVGVFRLEGRGVQLFDRIEGDHFTILGMPLLALLGALRERGLVLA